MIRTLGAYEDVDCNNLTFLQSLNPLVTIHCADAYYNSSMPAPDSVPGLAPPVAPQTKPAMTMPGVWTPDVQTEASAQRQIQQQIDLRNQTAPSDSSDDEDPSESHTLAWVLGSTAAVLFLALVLKR